MTTSPRPCKICSRLVSRAACVTRDLAVLYPRSPCSARQIVAIDVTRESYDQIGSPVIEKAGVAHKIDFRVGLALPVLDQMVSEVMNRNLYSSAFPCARNASMCRCSRGAVQG